MPEMTPYQKFAASMMQKDSRYIPEILKTMIDDDGAELLVSMPGTAEQLAKKTGRPVEEIEAALQDLFHKGLAFKKTKDGVTLWRAPMHIAQFHDATLLWQEAPPVFYELWRKYMEEEWPQLAGIFTKALKRPFTRVIPVNKSVEIGRVQVLAPENIREIVQSARRVAVTKCTCRLSMKKCDSPLEVCLQINNGADYTLERGTGREISREEALDILKQTEEAGLVHVTMNKAGVGHFICNCCGCCCQSFSLLISDGAQLCDPSRYRPEVDADACVGCGACEDRCWFHAIALGDDEIPVVDEAKCLGCGQCAVGCPEEAIHMKEAREPGFIPS